MSWKRSILLVLIGGFIVAAGIGFYLFNKPVKSLENAKPEFYISANELNTAFNENEKLANNKYLGKILELKGKIEEINETNHGMVVLSFIDPLYGVSCAFDSLQANQIKSFNPGDSIIVKGRCDGKLSDVRISKCFLVNKGNQKQ